MCQLNSFSELLPFLCLQRRIEASIALQNSLSVNVLLTEQEKVISFLLLYRLEILLEQGSYGFWKTWKVWNSVVAFSRTGKSWKKANAPEQLCKSF